VKWNHDHHYFGAVAERDMPALTLIWTEEPILHGSTIWDIMMTARCDNHEEEESFPRNHNEDDDYLRTVCGLTYQERKRFWHLHDQYNNNNNDKKRIWGILLTNSFCNRDLNMEPTCFLVVAKAFNHSCTPNVGFDFAGTTQRLWTTRPIRQGEELSICYNDVVYHHPAPIRQTFLQYKYKFLCTCRSCACVETKESDTRRRQIATLARCLSKSLPGAWFLYNEAFETEIRNVATQNGLPIPSDVVEENEKEEGKLFYDDDDAHKSIDVAFNRLLQYIDLVQQEGIDHDLLECYELAYDTAVMLKQTEKANELGKICSERFQVQKGPDHPMTKAFQIKWYTTSSERFGL